MTQDNTKKATNTKGYCTFDTKSDQDIMAKDNESSVSLLNIDAKNLM